MSIRLSDRMMAIVRMVSSGQCAIKDKNRIVADIGCDHGFVSIYMVQNGLADKMIAMDVAEGPLSTAKANVLEAGVSEKIELRYEPNVDIDEFKTSLYEKRNIDIKNTTTMTGPHRDDFGIFINDSDVRVYGSQGQQRTAALALKLAEIELVKKIINDDPILLLDDVMSELDTRRRDALLNSIKDIQTIITCTGYDDFIRQRINVDKIYKISQGKIV